MKAPRLHSFRLKNFKAVCDSGTIRFTPLTALIGNNGSGKSSLIEGLETLQMIVEDGLDGAMQHWRSFEHAWHQGVTHKLMQRGEGRPCHSNPMSFSLRGKMPGEIKSFSAKTQVTAGPGGNDLFFQSEEVIFRN